LVEILVLEQIVVDYIFERRGQCLPSHRPLSIASRNYLFAVATAAEVKHPIAFLFVMLSPEHYQIIFKGGENRATAKNLRVLCITPPQGPVIPGPAHCGARGIPCPGVIASGGHSSGGGETPGVGLFVTILPAAFFKRLFSLSYTEKKRIPEYFTAVPVP